MMQSSHHPPHGAYFQLTWQDYYFEEVQNVRVAVYDEDKKGSDNLDHHQLQGDVTFTIAELMCGPTN